MADARSPDEQITALQERLAVEFPELNQNISAELDALQKERGRFVFRSLVEGEPEAIERLSEIDGQIAQLEAKQRAVADETMRVQDELDGLTARIVAAASSANQSAAAKLGTTMDELEFRIRDSLFAAAQDLLKLRELSEKAQNKLIEAGLREESVRYTFGSYRNSLSAWAVLCLGRVGKLNLNSTISRTASEEWAKRKAA